MQNQLINNSAGSFEKYIQQLSNKIFSYGNATHAFVDLLLFLNTEGNIEKPNIIMPAFIPAKLHRIIKECGYVSKFYEINSKCEFDIKEIESLIDSQTKGIFAIHYFGHPTDISSLRDLSERNNIILIEDCAHVLSGNINGKALGTFGDASIFSIRKMLVTSDGGYLVINKNFTSFSPSYSQRVNSIYTFSKFIQSRSKNIYFNLTRGNDFLQIAKIPSKGFIDQNRKTKINLKDISTFSKYYSRVANIEWHLKMRKENYAFLFNEVKKFSFLQPIYNDLPINWTPYSFPVLVNGGSRDNLQLELLRSGISSGIGWPESPFENHLTRTLELSKHIIEFPVHPFIAHLQLEKLIKTCSSFEKNISRKFVQVCQLKNIENNLTVINKFKLNDLPNISLLGNSVSIKIVYTEAEFDNLKKEWNELCMNSNSHIFQTFEWQRIWWKYYGQNKQLFILLFYIQNKLVGICPFFIDTFKINKLVIFRRIKFIGASVEVDLKNKSAFDYGASDYLDLIILPGFENLIAENLFNFFFNNPKIYHAIQFDEISNDSNVFKYLLPIINSHKWNHKISKSDICPRILVPSTLADYMKCLSSKIRTQLSKIRRDINDPSLFRIKKVQSTQDLGHEFENFVRLHQQRWNAQGLPGAFVDSRYKKFLQEAVSEFLQNGLLHFTSAYNNGNCVAVECAFQYKNYIYDYLKAFDDRSQSAKYRPGRALLLLLIEEAIDNKSKVVDFLRGGEPYKFEIATEWHWIYKISIENPVFNFNVRYAMFISIIFLYQLKYHLIKEAHVIKVQFSNYGVKGFTKHYFPNMLKKLKSKFSENVPSTKNVTIANNTNTKKIKSAKVNVNSEVHELH